MLRSKILESIISAGKRFLRVEAFRGDNHRAKQYQPGGHDFGAIADIEALITKINNNNADNAIIAYRDKIAQIAESGELRLYGTTADGVTLLGSVHFKNDGNIEINTAADIKKTAANIENTTTVKHTISTVNIEEVATAAKVLTTPTFTINGNIIVNGNITATGTVTGTTDVIAVAISGSAHVHKAGTPPGDTGQPE